MKKMLRNLLGIRTDAENLFYSNEYSALARRTKSTFWALVSIILATLMALGFAYGSWQNLAVKMKNPYTNWVDLAISNPTIEKQTPVMQEAFEQDRALRKRFLLKSMSPYHTFWLDVYHRNFNPYYTPPGDSTFRIIGRTIEANEDILQAILDTTSNNVVFNRLEPDENGRFSLEDCSIIIKEEKLLELGFLNKDSITVLPLSYDSVPMLINVVAVVKDLPNLCDFVCAPRLHNIWSNREVQGYNCKNLIQMNHVGQTVFQCILPPNEASKVEAFARTFFGRALTDFEPRNKESYPFYAAQLSRLSLNTDLANWKRFLKRARSENIPVSDFAMIECANRCNDLSAPNNIAFNFERLDHIRAFKTYLKETYNVDLSMDQVESKDNFAKVTRLTVGVCAILLLLGIFCVILYVNNLLTSHLQEVKPNLGTFQAFGLSSHFLSALYRKIIFVFLASSSCVALSIAVVADRLEQLWNGRESFFNVLNWVIAVALILLFVLSLWWTNYTIKRILGDTPGNLIYGRSQQNVKFIS